MQLHSENIEKLMPGLIAARKSFKAAVKDAANDAFKKNGKGSGYATLDSVIDAVNEALLSNAILCTQPSEVIDGKIILHTRFIHESGQWIGGTYPIHPVKNDPQGEGSAMTYARRYALMALAGIAPEDDDGKAATKAVRKQLGQRQENEPLVKGNPSEGAWDQAEALGFSRSQIEEIAIVALEYWEIEDIGGAMEYIASKSLPNEAKIALNTLFPSGFRSAMKKHIQKPRDAE